jgi:hypothetical protein
MVPFTDDPAILYPLDAYSRLTRDPADPASDPAGSVRVLPPEALNVYMPELYT